jgi:hypothetical protein
MCYKVCATCCWFHRSENFDCEHWGDLPSDTNTDVYTCHVWTEGSLNHNLLFRIKQIEERLYKLH